MAQDKMSSFPCDGCGGDLHFKPGTQVLKCPYCGNEQKIPTRQESIQELDLEQFLKHALDHEEVEERLTLDCESCGGQVTLAENVTSDKCPFCGSMLNAQSKSSKHIKPRWLLPFAVDNKQAALHFRQWLTKLWFAPNQVKRFAGTDGLNGVYIPYWTFDCQTRTRYSGERGQHYYVTETYTVNEGGKSVTKTRQVQKTRWYPAHGTVFNTFDDILVLASKTLPTTYADRLEPWDLQELTSYDPAYLSGFRIESYGVDLPEGLIQAKEKAQPIIRNTICEDIGGDVQRIHSMDVSYKDITFKHILLPVWISAYRFRDKVYRFLVNARTGEVQGERPWSWIKIVSTVIGAAGTIGLIYYLYQYFGAR